MKKSASNEVFAKNDKTKFSTPFAVEVVASDSTKRIAYERSKESAVLFCNIGYRLESGNLIVTAATVEDSLNEAATNIATQIAADLNYAI